MNRLQELLKAALHVLRAQLLLLAVAAGTLAFLGLAYAVFPRHPDLRAFDPRGMARSETAMWRHYYERQYLLLFADLYGNSRSQYGFSPWESARIAFAAARAAKAFQPSNSRSGAQAALPYLEDYFALLARGTPVPLDIKAAARAELDWWQARREDTGPETYGAMIARVSALLYGQNSEKFRDAGMLRAEAMAFRDASADSMTDAGWSTIETILTKAYKTLKREVANTPKEM
jgi:hypothetical protein